MQRADRCGRAGRSDDRGAWSSRWTGPPSTRSSRRGHGGRCSPAPISLAEVATRLPTGGFDARPGPDPGRAAHRPSPEPHPRRSRCGPRSRDADRGSDARYASRTTLGAELRILGVADTGRDRRGRGARPETRSGRSRAAAGWTSRSRPRSSRSPAAGMRCRCWSRRPGPGRPPRSAPPSTRGRPPGTGSSGSRRPPAPPPNSGTRRSPRPTRSRSSSTNTPNRPTRSRSRPAPSTGCIRGRS